MENEVCTARGSSKEPHELTILRKCIKILTYSLQIVLKLEKILTVSFCCCSTTKIQLRPPLFVVSISQGNNVRVHKHGRTTLSGEPVRRSGFDLNNTQHTRLHSLDRKAIGILHLQGYILCN